MKARPTTAGPVTVGPTTVARATATGPTTAAGTLVRAATASPTAAPAATVRLTVTAPATARTGEPFTYTLRVANQGPATPASVVVRVLLPEGTVRTGASLPSGVGGEADGRFGQLVLPAMRPGTSLTMAITVQARQPGTLVNTARITSVEGVPDAWLQPAVTTTTRVR
jgi:uncharacterized repeat protein (TIGR01451 family)